MATVTSLQDDSFPSYNSGIASIQKVLAFSSSQAANGDQVNVMAIPAGAKKRLTRAVVRTSGTLGASATLQLRLNRDSSYTVLTAATGAGAASKVTDVAQAGVPIDLEGGDIIELLVGGADIAAAADVTVDLDLADRL